MSDTEVSYLLLLVCYQCKSIEEIPYVNNGKYLGDGKYDQSNNPFLPMVVEPHEKQGHVGRLIDIPAVAWLGHPEIKKATIEKIKEQMLAGGSSGLDVFGDFYNVKDNYSADAMTCYSLHLRPKGQCPDYKSDKKVLEPATKAERKEAGLGKSKVKIYLCDFCPVKMYNQKKAFTEKGLYE